MIRALVARSMIQARLAEGWQFAKGDSADGRQWIGDAVVMEMPEEKYEKLQKERRASYEQLQRYVASGEMPVRADEPGITFKFTREGGEEERQPRKRGPKTLIDLGAQGGR
jgi:hypothetical protein